MPVVNVHEAKTQLSQLLARVEAGEEVVIRHQSGVPALDHGGGSGAVHTGIVSTHSRSASARRSASPVLNVASRPPRCAASPSSTASVIWR